MSAMECLGPQCAAVLLEWLQQRTEEKNGRAEPSTPARRQGTLWTSAPYEDEAPSIRSTAELAGAFEHLEYSVFRRYENQLTRSERIRLENTIKNTLFKIDRHAEHLERAERARVEAHCQEVRASVRESQKRDEQMRQQAWRASEKVAQLSTLTPEGFEEFVAEVFEALGFDVDRRGGTGDEGVDLGVRRAGLLGVVQCKHNARGVVGSPDLQKFLGTIHHTRSHKGFFVTTS